MEILKIMILVSLCLNTQANMKLHVNESCSQLGWRDCSSFVDNISFQVVNSARLVVEHPILHQTSLEEAQKVMSLLLGGQSLFE